MKFTFIGAGAIGGVVGAYLAKNNEDVTLVDINEEHIEAIKNNGITIQTQNGNLNVPVKAKTVQELIHNKEELDVVVLAVKAQHTEEAVKSFMDLLTENSVVISMQNGLCENVISSLIGKDRTIGSFVNLFADYLEPGVIEYGGVGSLYIGELNGSITPRLKALQERFKAWGEAKVTDNIFGYLWSKLSYGSILTATALVDEKMAEIIDPVENRKLFVELGSEALTVADKLGVLTLGFDDWEPSIVYSNTEERDWDAIHAQFDRLVKRLRSYKKVKTGIWRDLAVRKRKTEVPFHLEPVIQQGKELGIDMSLTQATLDMIIDLENNRRVMSWDNIEQLRKVAKKKATSIV